MSEKGEDGMRFRVGVECRNPHRTEAMFLILAGATPKDAAFRAVRTLQSHYPEYDEFEPFLVEKVKSA